MDRIGEFTFEQQDWTFKSSRPSIVLFFSSICEACKYSERVLGRLMIDYVAKVDFYEVNLDEESLLECMLDVRRVPSLLFVNPLSGLKATVSGTSPEDDLRDLIEEYLLPKRA